MPGNYRRRSALLDPPASSVYARSTHTVLELCTALPMRSASAPFPRRSWPSEATRTRSTQLRRPTDRKPEGAGAIDHGHDASPPELEDTGSAVDTHSCRASFASSRSADFCCAICIELLLRPVVLSCGHHFCRGCWVRLLQGSQARSAASRTGRVACPLGRCEVRPHVPDIDRDLENEMHSQLGLRQCTALAVAAERAPHDEESAAAAAVNVWAAAGCQLDRPEEIQAPAEELAAAAAAARAMAAVVIAVERSQRRSKLRSQLGHFGTLLLLITLIGFGLFVLNGGSEVSVVCPPLHKWPPPPCTHT